MGDNYKRILRKGISLPELVGVIACLGVGMFAGAWLFLKDSPQESEHAPVNSTVASDAVATAAPGSIETPSISKEEADLRAIQQNIINEINASHRSAPASGESGEASVEPANPTINVDNVRDLLGESQATRPDHGNSLRSHAPAKLRAQATNPTSRGVASETGSTGPQTLAYWNAMNNTMAEEEAMRAAPAGGITKENAADFIARRGKAGNYAAAELRGLDRSGVDPAVIALGGDIANWYEQGTQLNDRASYLLNQANDQTRQGQTGRNWGNSEKAHSASVAEINRRGDALRQQMSKKYGLKFPDLR